MIKTAYAIAVSAFAASLFVAFPSWRHADIRPLGTECGVQAWPYFEAACTHDACMPLAQPRDVRMVAADRTAN
jgi:hypothetical protein